MPVPKAITRRAQALAEQIEDYRYRYHVLNESIMSEASADSLKHELVELEEKYPELITPSSPSQRVAGGVLPGFSKHKHSSRMLSLNDVFSRQELEAWVTRVHKLQPDWKPEFHIDLKYDGLAMALVYESGKLVKAATRGDGFVGEDVTANIRTLESIPLQIKTSAKRVEVRGEVLIYTEDFIKLNQERVAAGEPAYANPRNLAAGTIRQLDTSLVAKRPLRFHAWAAIGLEERSHQKVYESIKKLGFFVNPNSVVVNSVDQIMKFVQKWQEKRQTLPYGTDGLVVTVNSNEVFQALGVVGKAPRGAVAFKFPAEQTTTIVKDIFISVGRTGAATPVAMLMPVLVAGSTVQMATLHNAGEVARKDIRIGDTVVIQKAGDIIPEVVESLIKLRPKNAKRFKMPANCPECGTKLVKEESEAVWRCPNPACPARVHNQIRHFASKSALNIDGMGQKNVKALLDAGLISDSADLFGLSYQQIVELDRFAELSATNLIKAISEVKNPPLDRFIFGLGIRHVGSQTAQDLAKKYDSLQQIAKASIEELLEIEGIGEVVAESIVAWFSEDQNQIMLKKFADYSVIPKKQQVIKSSITDKSFVITGTLHDIGRDEAAAEIRKRGGVFQSSVGKDTDYLVFGDKAGNSKKQKAEKLGTKIISEKQFLSLLK